MKLFDAVNTSPSGIATRELTDNKEDYDGDEPNIVLIDNGHRPPKIKAFRAIENVAWERRPLKKAKKFEDWEPLIK